MIGGLRMSCLRLTGTADAPLLCSSKLPLSPNCRRLLIIRPVATLCSAKATKNKKKVIVISGPTGKGKSRLALELAKQLNGEIISADSVQVYRGLDVGSAKPSLAERQEVRHHLIDILHPSEDYSVGQFCEDARQVTSDVLNRGRVPIVAGGTGLYLRWFIYGKPDVPKASREITSEVHSELSELQRDGDWDGAIDLLIKAGDPSVQTLAANDWYRLRRRLEIIKSSGAPPSAFQVPYNSFKKNSDSGEEDIIDANSATSGFRESKSNDLDYDFICVFLSTQRLDLYRAIDFRCEDMLLGEFCQRQNGFSIWVFCQIQILQLELSVTDKLWSIF